MAEPTLVINGRDYPFPTVDTWDVGEARVLHRYTRMTLDQLGETEDYSDPNLTAAFCHIALARESPNASFDQIEKAVNRIKLVQIQTRDGDEVTEQVDPPSQPSGPPKPNENEPSTGPSGTDGSDLGQEQPSLRAIGGQG